MTYNNSWLIEKYRRDEEYTYVFFWGHKPSADGSITKSCLSQWWLSAFEMEGTRYATAEHWMMHKKALQAGDGETAALILNTLDPKEAKQLGRQVKNFNPSEWDTIKFDTVCQGNLHKFSQHPELKAFLLGTGDSILVEASPVDPVWGIGMAKDNKHITNPEQWRGDNLLGYALMQVRDKLRLQSLGA
ncbi:MAG: NADAR family protein [Bacteroidota bacterium]